MRIYIASALTHVPRADFAEYARFLHELAAKLRAEVANSTVKYALVNSDPQLAEKPSNERTRLCYIWDRTMVEEADVLIAEASFPSIGLGIELQLAEAKGTPIILAYRDFGTNRAPKITYTNPDHETHELQIGEGFVTLMALGLPNLARTIRYTSVQDGISQLLGAVQLLSKPGP